MDAKMALKSAMHAAQAARDVLLRHFGHLSKVREKGLEGLVSEKAEAHGSQLYIIPNSAACWAAITFIRVLRLQTAGKQSNFFFHLPLFPLLSAPWHLFYTCLHQTLLRCFCPQILANYPVLKIFNSRIHQRCILNNKEQPSIMHLAQTQAKLFFTPVRTTSSPLSPTPKQREQNHSSTPVLAGWRHPKAALIPIWHCKIREHFRLAPILRAHC